LLRSHEPQANIRNNGAERDAAALASDVFNWSAAGHTLLPVAYIFARSLLPPPPPLFCFETQTRQFWKFGLLTVAGQFTFCFKLKYHVVDYYFRRRRLVWELFSCTGLCIVMLQQERTEERLLPTEKAASVACLLVVVCTVRAKFCKGHQEPNVIECCILLQN
jgi:hypothetical protein